MLAGVRIVASFLPWREELIFTLAAQLVLAVPVFAMFARRMYDRNLSAWGLVILPPVFAINIYGHLRFILLDPRTGALGLPELAGWLNVVWSLLVIAYLIFRALSGTKGASSYGPAHGGPGRGPVQPGLSGLSSGKRACHRRWRTYVRAHDDVRM